MPRGFEDRALNRGMRRAICKLNKSLYGLKQAPRIWAKVLCDFLRKFGLRRLQTDHCIFAGRGLIEIFGFEYRDHGGGDNGNDNG